MDWHNSKASGWTLVVGGFLLLAAMGKLDLVVLLLPIAAVVAYGITRLPAGNTALRRGLK
jgi:hypothetical protein